jgi:hypothetical protein
MRYIAIRFLPESLPMLDKQMLCYDIRGDWGAVHFFPSGQKRLYARVPGFEKEPDPIFGGGANLLRT